MSPFHVSINLELTGLGLIAVAIWALRFTRRQISEMQESNRKQAESARNQELQLRAGVLLSLDERWESQTMTVSRVELQALIMAVLREVAADWPQRSAGDLRKLSAPYFVSRLKRLETEDAANNLRIFQICGFFETVGYVARAGYITIADVQSLLGGSIKTASMVFRPYIQDLLSFRNADPRLFEHFLWLIDEIERREAISLEGRA